MSCIEAQDHKAKPNIYLINVMFFVVLYIVLSHFTKTCFFFKDIFSYSFLRKSFLFNSNILSDYKNKSSHQRM